MNLNAVRRAVKRKEHGFSTIIREKQAQIILKMAYTHEVPVPSENFDSDSKIASWVRFIIETKEELDELKVRK